MIKLLFFLPILLFSFVSTLAQTEVENYLQKAGQFGEQRKFEEAAAEISRAIAIQPNNAELYFRRAEYYWLLKKNQELISDVHKAISLNQTDKKILYAGALRLHRAGEYKEAFKIIEALFALGDPDMSAWQLRIQIKTYLEDFIGAFEDISKAIELYPQDSYLMQNQANLVRLLGDSDKAVGMYDSLIAALETKLNGAKDENEKGRIKNELAMFLLGRARVYQNKYNNEQMNADLIKALEYAPTILNYQVSANLYKQARMYNESIANYTKAIELEAAKNKSPVLFIYRGDVYYLMQKYAEAIQDFEQAAKMDEQQLREQMQKRIALAKQKMQENGIQPK